MCEVSKQARVPGDIKERGRNKNTLTQADAAKQRNSLGETKKKTDEREVWVKVER